MLLEIKHELESFRASLEEHLEEHEALESDYIKAVDAIESFSYYGIVDAIAKIGYLVALEHGNSIPGLWRLSKNRTLELLAELEETVKIQCQALQAAIS